jgi:hypothetical protein
MAKTNKLYQMNGKQYTSLKDIAEELGVSRIRPDRHFEKYGITEVTAQDTTAEQTEEVKASEPEVAATEENTQEETKVSSKQEKHADKVAESTKNSKAEDKKSEASEDTSADDLAAFSKIMTETSTEDLIKMSKKAGLGDGSQYKHEGIRRMRLIMGLKKQRFPEFNKRESHSHNSIWKDTPLKELLKIAKDKGISYRVVKGNDNIQRMWVTKALVDAKVQMEEA